MVLIVSEAFQKYAEKVFFNNQRHVWLEMLLLKKST